MCRFYFVGDEDLLEIIGNSKSVPKLQKHFKKMFAGVASVVLSEDGNEVLGISSKEGEQVCGGGYVCASVWGGGRVYLVSGRHHHLCKEPFPFLCAPPSSCLIFPPSLLALPPSFPSSLPSSLSPLFPPPSLPSSLLPPFLPFFSPPSCLPSPPLHLPQSALPPHIR